MMWGGEYLGNVTIRGIIEDILYENAFGWSAIRIRSEDQVLRAAGELGRVKTGESWSIVGQWENHPIHGSQLKILSGFPVMPEGTDELIALLSGDQFPGVGAATAVTLVKFYGNNLWDVLENEQSRLNNDRIITPNKANLIIKALKGLQPRWELLRFLVEFKLPVRLLQPLTTLYIENAVKRIKENPYRLLSFTDWTTADRVAQRFGIHKDDIRRLEAAVVSILQHYLGRGHTALLRDVLVQEASKRTGASIESFKNIITEPFISFAGDGLVQLTGIASQERTVAKTIAKLSCDAQPLASSEWVEKWLDKYAMRKGIQLDTDQRRAVHKAVHHRLLILTGGPGTGKTSVIDAICSILEEMGQEVMLSAPTGRAAKRIQETTGKDTRTLHRTFGYSQKEFNFKQKDLESISLIVDESSMVDLRLWNIIMASVRNDTRLIIVGDSAQLPSVGPGQILNDLILSSIPNVELTKIHRQASDNPIPYVSKSIKKGIVPELPSWNHQLKGVFLIEQDDEKKGADWTVRLGIEALTREGISFEEVQVLCPLKKGYTGTSSINSYIRHRLGSINISDVIPFAVGDRVIQTVNNYDLGSKGVMNGSTGKVVDFLEDGIVVNFDFENVDIRGTALAELDYAYGISVHKSQGSQYKAVIIPLYPSAGPLINRQLIYTAITRATDLAIIIGTKETFEQAVKNYSLSLRKTGFSFHLDKALKEQNSMYQRGASLQMGLFE